MHLNLVHVDDALRQQPLFLEQCRALQARETEASTQAAPVRLWGKTAALDALKTHLSSGMQQGSGTVVTFMGSGDFHHVSALLIAMHAEKTKEPFTVIHFDNHPDWVHFSGGMHCGSWVNRALEQPQVDRVITLGVCSRDLSWPQFKRANLQAWRDKKIIMLPWHSSSPRFRGQDIEKLEPAEIIASLEELVSTRNIYITIDKDVLAHEDAITNWDQGQMRLTTLLTILRALLARHHAIGIDVTGDYSAPHYAGTLSSVAFKKLESMLDQPRQAPDAANAAAVNQISNMALLDCIREAA